MDQRSEQLIVDRITRGPARTTASSARRAPTDAGTSGVTWVIDPIDGTVNYLYEIPAYAVSVGGQVGVPRSWPAPWSTRSAVRSGPHCAAKAPGWTAGGSSWPSPRSWRWRWSATGFGYDAAPPGPAGRGLADRAAAGT